MDALLFNFRGALADSHRMDFYETSRFQYAVARLSVKLDQFRRTGRFSKRVTAASRTNIDLYPFEKGSFNLKISASEDADENYHVNVPLTALWTYVIERVFRPTDTYEALDLIDTTSLRSEFFDIIENNIFKSEEAIRLLRSKINSDGGLTSHEQELLDRLISESERRGYLKSHHELLGRITAEEDASLVTMSAPLLAEIAVPLRRSAKLVTISTIDRLGSRQILTANKEMAEDIELINIDQVVSQIDVNIVQYNKENGWGKFRNPYWDGIPSFSVPADRKDHLKFNLLSAMREDTVSVNAYIVRGVSNEPVRLIIVDVNAIDEENVF